MNENAERWVKAKPTLDSTMEILYGCANARCAEEHSWPPADLDWYPGKDQDKAGWYCCFCWDYLPELDDDYKPISLLDHLRSISEDDLREHVCNSL